MQSPHNDQDAQSLHQLHGDGYFCRKLVSEDFYVIAVAIAQLKRRQGVVVFLILNISSGIECNRQIYIC